jgi:hypothetical protein
MLIFPCIEANIKYLKSQTSWNILKKKKKRSNSICMMRPMHKQYTESEAISDLGNANIMTFFTHHLQIREVAQAS